MSSRKLQRLSWDKYPNNESGGNFMKYLQLKLENKELREENETLKQTIKIMQGIIETEDDCVNKLLASTLADAKRLADKHGLL